MVFRVWVKTSFLLTIFYLHFPNYYVHVHARNDAFGTGDELSPLLPAETHTIVICGVSFVVIVAQIDLRKPETTTPSPSCQFLKIIILCIFRCGILNGHVQSTIPQFAFFKATYFAGNPHLCGSFLNNPCDLAPISSPPRKSHGDFKLIFAAAAIIKAKSFKKTGRFVENDVIPEAGFHGLRRPGMPERRQCDRPG
ncbi:PREDICTED: uncharacterized protein LOC109152775 [Ipomoea nil]|uniref:uncharacterized protein LOC109152775 n=1 Tax=Ipomoea nil TaxID=35883 RepID=UPI000901F48B|nr:PREDICTED: uncharacterized protein LOC109152775 [Ipomoea nil]